MQQIILFYICGGILARHEGGSVTITNSYYTTTGSVGVYGNEKYVTADTLKGYATTLGNVYLTDEYNINDGYPILEWELNAKKIIGKAYVNANEEKIVIEVTHHINPISSIAKIVNGIEIPIVMFNETSCKDTLSDGTHTYVVTDSEGNKLKLKIGPIKVLSSASDLCSFRDEVNNGNSFAGTTVYQTADIDLSSVCGEGIGSWKPIGTGDNLFAGTYDGQYHTINNLYINTNEYAYLGLFTETTEKTIIKNLLLENVQIYNQKSTGTNESRTGGITGRTKGTIENCGVESGNIKTVANVNIDEWYNAVTAGITGFSMENSSISNCYNKAIIYTEVKNNVGNCRSYAAGIAGTTQKNVKITNCYNMGDLTTKGGYFSFIAGIVGAKGSHESVVIKNCYNTGSLTASEYSGSMFSGGILGLHEGGSVTISNSYYTKGHNNVWGNEVQVSAATLQGYASTLGDAYTNDDGRNNGYPILKWEKEVR